MTSVHDFLAMDDARLLADCDIHIYKASGPGGQHRNKVSSAVRLRHRPTGLSATANDSRSQHSNKTLALTRLRMNLAMRLREPLDPAGIASLELLPPELREVVFLPKKAPPGGAAGHRLEIGRKDQRFWAVAARLLDLLDGAAGRLAPVAAAMDITTGNLTRVLECDRHLLAAAQEVRKAHGRQPIQ